MQARIHWPSWSSGHTAGSCSSGCQSTSPGPFLLGRFPATLTPACNIYGVVVTQVQDPALGAMWLDSAYWFSLLRFLCRAFLFSNKSTVLSTWYYLWAFWGCTQSLFRSLIKMVTKTGPGTELLETSLCSAANLFELPSQWLLEPVHPASSSPSKPYTSKPWVANFSRRMLWETVSKTLLKSMYIMSAAFFSPTTLVILSCKEIRLVINACWLLLITVTYVTILLDWFLFQLCPHCNCRCTSKFKGKKYTKSNLSTVLSQWEHRTR